MMSINLLKSNKGQHFFNQLKVGNETGLNHFYNELYPRLAWWALKRVKDDVAASSITHEAFLKLWLLREKIEDCTKLLSFLNQQIRQGCDEFYQKTSPRFHRNLIKLDNIEDYQEFMAGYNPEDEPDEIDTVYQQELDQAQKEQWAVLEAILPNIPKDQQLFIKLCLQYDFNYERIAWHLGGTSDYEVAGKIEKTIKTLKNVLVNANKLELTAKAKTISFEGEITEEQSEILNMRYELQFSFEEIATALGLSQSHVQKTFVQARLAVNKVKKTN